MVSKNWHHKIGNLGCPNFLEEDKSDSWFHSWPHRCISNDFGHVYLHYWICPWEMNRMAEGVSTNNQRLACNWHATMETRCQPAAHNWNWTIWFVRSRVHWRNYHIFFCEYSFLVLSVHNLVLFLSTFIYQSVVNIGHLAQRESYILYLTNDLSDMLQVFLKCGNTYFDMFSTIDIEQEPTEGEFMALACDFHDLSSCFMSYVLHGFAPILFNLVIVCALNQVILERLRYSRSNKMRFQ